MTNMKPYNGFFLVGLHDMVKVCSDIFKKHTAFNFGITESGKGDRACAKPVVDEHYEMDTSCTASSGRGASGQV
jgi:hypothetical protein